MKAFFLTVLLFIGSSQIFAGKPPEVVAKALKQKFPSAINITWIREDSYHWKSNFTTKNRKLSASFDSDGHWYLSQMEITFAELRIDEVRSAIKKDYPSCTIVSIIINERQFGTFYDVKVKCGNTISYDTYDGNGMHLPKITQLLKSDCQELFG